MLVTDTSGVIAIAQCFAHCIYYPICISSTESYIMLCYILCQCVFVLVKSVFLVLTSVDQCDIAVKCLCDLNSAN